MNAQERVLLARKRREVAEGAIAFAVRFSFPVNRSEEAIEAWCDGFRALHRELGKSSVALNQARQAAERDRRRWMQAREGCMTGSRLTAILTDGRSLP